MQMIHGRTLDEWKKEINILSDLLNKRELLWVNPRLLSKDLNDYGWNVTEANIMEASGRLDRFAPLLEVLFPELKQCNGKIESPLLPTPKLKIKLEQRYQQNIKGSLYLKADQLLPISGSIKARGGIYEVLKHAEDLAIKNDLIKPTDDYSLLAEEKFKHFFSRYSIAVGSTGNLGLSIGVIGSKLGFRVIVHMSAEAKKWKKDLLRSLGVSVIEYDSDYTKAVEEGRKQATEDPYCYFIDDETSKHLFLGYAVAAYRLEEQLHQLGIKVDGDHPLFVYLPCGVGGGPGGITYGLKNIFQHNVHCFFVEPTESASVLLGMATKLGDQVSVHDFGLSNETAADGLAVGKPSGFVIKNMEKILSGVLTIKDQTLFQLLNDFYNEEGMFLEPSAVAGAIGPIQISRSTNGVHYVDQYGLVGKMENATHIIWGTGGSLVPVEIQNDYLNNHYENK